MCLTKCTCPSARDDCRNSAEHYEGNINLAYFDPLPDLQWLQLSPAKPFVTFWHLVALGLWLQLVPVFFSSYLQ